MTGTPAQRQEPRKNHMEAPSDPRAMQEARFRSNLKMLRALWRERGIVTPPPRKRARTGARLTPAPQG